MVENLSGLAARLTLAMMTRALRRLASGCPRKHLWRRSEGAHPGEGDGRSQVPALQAEPLSTMLR